MEVEEVLLDLLAEADFLLTEAESELRLVEERVKALDAERYGLQLALDRRRGVATTAVAPSTMASSEGHDPAPSWEPAPWPTLSRAEAVLQLLLEEEAPLSRVTITQRLAELGREGDDPDAVSAALAYLRRTGRAERAGPGQWVASGPSVP